MRKCLKDAFMKGAFLGYSPPHAAMMNVCRLLTHAEPADPHAVGHAGSVIHDPR